MHPRTEKLVTAVRALPGIRKRLEDQDFLDAIAAATGAMLYRPDKPTMETLLAEGMSKAAVSLAWLSVRHPNDTANSHALRVVRTTGHVQIMYLLTGLAAYKAGECSKRYVEGLLFPVAEVLAGRTVWGKALLKQLKEAVKIKEDEHDE